MGTNLKLCFPLVLMLALLGCQSNQLSPKALQSSIASKAVADFEGSGFFHTNGLIKKNGWPLQNGNTNTVYESPKLLENDIELETNGDNFVSVGVTFFERDSLSDKDLEFIYDLLNSLGTSPTPDAKQQIKLGAEKPAHQIYEAPPIKAGAYKVFAAKVGSEQVISINRL